MKVLLLDLSAKNTHKALAPWCIKAYCDKYAPGSEIIVSEHTINDKPAEIIDSIYLTDPDVLGFSCYIWNADLVCKLSRLVKEILPNCIVVLGGPEVSFEDDFSGFPFADYIIKGAGEAAFASLLNTAEENGLVEKKIIIAEDCAFSEALSPYTQEFFESFAKGRMLSIRNQLIYYESSRGCPFSCSYCLSSTTADVRYLPLDRVFRDIELLVSNGAVCIKFVDRTFNADNERAISILNFIQSLETDCVFHFEIAPDLFNDKLLMIIKQMPLGRVQFEIGIQSLNDKTLCSVNRKTDLDVAVSNIRQLIACGNTHIHVDLIAGLPWETLSSFKAGVDRCLALRPHMLQLGLLKMLKGTDIRENSVGYSFNPYPPYQIFKSGSMSFRDILEIRRVEEAINRFYNSGMFVNSIDYAIKEVFQGGYKCFYEIHRFSENRFGNLSLKNAYTMMYDFLCAHGSKIHAEHYVKLDCLTYDVKGVLPDAIEPRRDKAAEKQYRENNKQHKNIRIEHFSFDRKARIFVYDKRCPVTKAHYVNEIAVI
jgi:radical SAM superfamily enzyme YgiQ (UPF0313 family)